MAGGNGSPVEFMKKHHGRITRVHVKDRKWDPATIEFEYKVPAGSDRMTEIARTVKYCRDALV